MTDYGRGSGSQPWHPEDPLFGDVYDAGQDAQSYPGQGYPQAGNQQPQQPQQGGWQDPYAAGQPQQAPYPGQQYPQTSGHPQQGGYPQQPQHPQGHPQQQYPQPGYEQPVYDPSGQPVQPGYDTGAYHTGGYGHQDPYGGHQPQDPYGGQQDFYGPDGYPTPQQAQQQQPQPPQQPQQPQQPQYGRPPQQGMPQPGMPQQGAQPGMPQQGTPGGPQDPGQDFDQTFGQARGPAGPGAAQGGPGTAGAGPGTAQGGGRPQEPGVRPLRTAPERTGDWDADNEGDPHDHAFFSGGDDRDDDGDSGDDVPGATGRRRSGAPAKRTGKKRRSGCACLVVAVVLVGGIAGAGYAGYNFYESRFGPAPDYSGQGAGDVQVVVPIGSSLNAMGNILKTAGVVKSVDAFAEAGNSNPKGRTIQAGTYILHRQMSAAAAVTMMLDPTSQNAMIIPEGLRATEVYARIDTKLKLKAGTTAAAVKGASLGLPSWADGSVEGFLFPAKYSVAENMKPLDLVKEMVDHAKAEYTEDGLESAAAKVNKTPRQVIVIASLVQAEAQEKDDFGKVSQVIYNRLDQDMALGFDSTINYAKGRSTLSTSVQDTKFASPYNTYIHKGLPPGPIDNPGHQAIQAALNPTSGDWLYFVTVKPGDTRFTASYSEHQKNVADFNAYQKAHPQ